MSHPKLSILIPTYNRREYVRQGIESALDAPDGQWVKYVFDHPVAEEEWWWRTDEPTFSVWDDNADPARTLKGCAASCWT